MISSGKKKVLFIIFFCLAVLSEGLSYIDYFNANKNLDSMFLMLTIMFGIAGIIFLILYLKDKSNNKDNKQNFVKIKSRSIKEIMEDKTMDSYDKFVEWWSNCDENMLSNNSLLLGACEVMTFYNEVCNGGFGQFFDYAENWDFNRTKELFKWLLPKDFYNLFCSALKAYENNEDCEKFNKEFNYNDMEQKILPKLAERVVNNYRYNVTLTEYDLIEGITPYLKQKGYKKKGKRWIKDIGEFTLCFYLQGSSYDVDDYYIRPGIFINGVAHCGLDFYGHFFVELKRQSVEQVLKDYEQFITEWTDKPLIKQRLIDFNKWEERNPLEKRRSLTSKDAYKDDPIPDKCDMFFKVSDILKSYILKNF